LGCQSAGQVFELAGEILVDKKEIHVFETGLFRQA